MEHHTPDTSSEKLVFSDEIMRETAAAAPATSQVQPQEQDMISPETHDIDESLTSLERTIQLRDKLEALIRRTSQTKRNCEKLDHDNKYLQEYVGNLMNSGEFLTKRL